MFETSNEEKYGLVAGYIFSYFLFTTILFLIFNLVYFHSIGITLIIVLGGLFLKKIL
tara:strand:- start:295 stop:465 length:171 start_codon:yes stop_codon:yes gene_type:complete